MIGITMSSCASDRSTPAGAGRPRVFAFAAALALAIGARAGAQSGSEPSANFGFLGQGNAGVTYVNPAVPAPYNVYQQYSVNIQPNACVPTATANGLTYLENYAVNTLKIADPFATSPNQYSQVNALAQAMGTFNLTNATNQNNGPFTNVGGTAVSSMYNGLQSYLGTNNPAHNVTMSGETASPYSVGTFNAGTNVVQNTTPSAAYLAGLLNANDAVEFWIQWGTYSTDGVFTRAGGAHCLTLTSINVAAGSGFISFIDPWGLAGLANPQSSGMLTTASLVVEPDGYLYVTYPTVIAEADDQPNPLGPDILSGAGPNTGRIVVVMAEAVPEPSSLVLVAIAAPAALGVGLVRGRRSAARRPA